MIIQRNKLRIVLRCLLLIYVGFASVCSGQNEHAQPSRHIVHVDGNSPEEFSLSFPTAMVSLEAIDTEVKGGPVLLKPALEGKFRWRSQTEGDFTAIAPVPPGTRFQVLLTTGLADLAGKPVLRKRGGEKIAEFTTAPFKIRSYTFKTELPLRPSVAVNSTHPVKPEEVVRSAFFQDRDSRERFPVEVIVGEDAGETVQEFTVTPRGDLLAGRTIDLIVDGLQEAATGTALPELFVMALGETEALRVIKVAAFNYPLKKPRITVEFNEPVNPSEGSKISIEPKVEGVECIQRGEELWLQGDFDITRRYVVTIPKGVTGKRGYGLSAESRWGATFRPKKPAIIFPTEDLHQRSRLGLRFAFLQVNSGPLEWRLAKVPSEKLLAVNRRVREFTEREIDPVTGEDAVNSATGLPKWKPTELLIESSRLEVVTKGRIDASEPEADKPREIVWKPEGDLAAGVYVLEVSGKNAEGKMIGNRALITFTEYALVPKRTPEEMLLRLINVSDGRSVAGVKIRAVSATNELRAEFKTDQEGVARIKTSDIFPKEVEPAKWFLIDTPEGTFLRPIDATPYRESGSGYNRGYESTNEQEKTRGVVTTDRPLYRPGHTVKFKGFVRDVKADGSGLDLPRARKTRWRITSSSDLKASGVAKVDDYGGFEGEWKIPESTSVDRCELSVEAGELETSFEVQEYRPPPFLVEIADRKLPGTTGGVRISSAYFHGAPNIGARVKWKASWSRLFLEGRDDRFVMTDVPREAPVQEFHKVVEGEGIIGADGALEVESAPPFTDGIPRGWYEVEWSVEVTGLDGQTITEIATASVYAVPYQLSLVAEQAVKIVDSDEDGKNSAKPEKRISFSAGAFDSARQPVEGASVTVDIYRVSNKTAKERIAPNIFRYRNSVTFEKERTIKGKTPLSGTEAVQSSGGYLVTVRVEDSPSIPATVRHAYVSGEEGEFAQRNEDEIGVTSDKKEYHPGETAILSVQAPFPGVAWVCVEAESVLDSYFVTLSGNTSRIELPIKKAYSPNVVATVYLLRTGGEKRLPAERFGSVRLEVRRPDLELKVLPQLAAKQVEPRGTIAGEIIVTSEDQPVAGADVTVYAVDEAVLDAGDWHEPPLRVGMYPQRKWTVSSYHGLEKLSAGVGIDSLHQKGFILGDSVYKASVMSASKELRTNFPPLAFWQTQLRSDKGGRVPFSFKAPDGLTKYRVIALAQTRKHQFGTGSDWVEVAKPLQVEPALPRFVRVGDEVELRAIVRQKIADELPVTLRCTTELQLEGSDSQTQTIKRNVPAVFRFRAKVGEIGSAKVRFESLQKEGAEGDAVEIVLPVHPPTLLRKEALFGTFDGVKKEISPEWRKATGSVEVTLSTSPWLPKLTGLPVLLDYPHGCFEQVASRVLGYTVLGSFLEYLPNPSMREIAYQKRVAAGLETMANGLTREGYLPYWPGGSPSGLPSISGYWAAKSAKASGIAVPQRLTESLQPAIRAMASGEKGAPADPFSRAFALMVLSEEGDSKRYASVVRELYAHRERWSDEPRALLAIAMHQFGIMPKEKEQLCREINRPIEERGFDPESFGSTTRAEAIRALAFAIINPPEIEGEARGAIRKKIEESLDSARSLSTQENFWLLLAFKAMHAPLQGPLVDFRRSNPQPSAISRNGASALWSAIDIRKIEQFAVNTEQKDSLTCLMEAQYRSDSPVTQRTDHGFRVERVVKNLTAAERTGTKEAPFKLGDEILLTYRLHSPKLQHYVALEDELPGALEVVNPKVASIARTYSLPPPEKDVNQLALSFSELRDRMACLYFDRVSPGIGSYSILARATCAGSFHWPATQVTPMYDSRFSGLSPSSVCYVVGE